MRRDPQSSMNECGNWDGDSRPGRAKREAKSNVERLAGKTIIIYIGLKVRKRGLDLCGKVCKMVQGSDQLFKGEKEGYFSYRHKQWESSAWSEKKEPFALLTPYSPPQKHLPTRLKEEHDFRGELRHRSVLSDLIQNVQKFCI